MVALSAGYSAATQVVLMVALWVVVLADLLVVGMAVVLAEPTDVGMVVR